MTRIAALTEDDIPELLGAVYASRGDSYQKQGRVHHCRRTRTQLSALCDGSRPTPYKVRVDLDDGEVAGARCSCPIGGWCKHVAALLYEWVREPKACEESSSLQKRLEGCSKEDLLAIIDKMLFRRPELEEFVDVWILAQATGSDEASQERRVERDEFYKRAEQIVRGYTGHGWDYGATSGVVSDLEELLSIGLQYADADRPADAAAVFGGVLQALRENYDYFDDSNGEYGDILIETTAQLAEAFEQITDTFARAEVIPDLWNAWVYDNEFGGIGMMEAVEDAVVKTGRESEKDCLLDWLNEYLQKIPQDDEWSTGWRRESAGEFALTLEADQLSEDEYLDRCRQLGQLDRLVPALLDRGLVDEARERAAEAEPSKLRRFADLFIAHDLSDDAVDLMQSAVQRADDYRADRLRDWLIGFYADHDQPGEALPYARANFDRLPSAKSFMRVRQLAREVERWEELRPELVDRLRQDAPFELVEVYLQDGEHDAAIDLWADAADTGYLGIMSAAKIAEAVRQTHPDSAIDLWLQAADHFISDRGRGNYRRACAYLAETRDVYRDTGRTAQWDELVNRLFEEHRRLSAFKDEMRKAGLAPKK
jgi:uncharacterized Zn finger protein